MATMRWRRCDGYMYDATVRECDYQNELAHAMHIAKYMRRIVQVTTTCMFVAWCSNDRVVL